jgi:hypothetical protein
MVPATKTFCVLFGELPKTTPNKIPPKSSAIAEAFKKRFFFVLFSTV